MSLNGKLINISVIINSCLSIFASEWSKSSYRVVTVWNSWVLLLFWVRNIDREVVNSLLSLLDNKKSAVRSNAFAALGQLAKTSDIIRPDVLQWLEQHPHDDVIGSAIDCLWSIVVE